jgi:hypothetical protein
MMPNGLILHLGRIFVPNDNDIRLRILRAPHDHPLAGHPGITETLELIGRDFIGLECGTLCYGQAIILTD